MSDRTSIFLKELYLPVSKKNINKPFTKKEVRNILDEDVCNWHPQYSGYQVHLTHPSAYWPLKCSSASGTTREMQI